MTVISKPLEERAKRIEHPLVDAVADARPVDLAPNEAGMLEVLGDGGLPREVQTAQLAEGPALGEGTPSRRGESIEREVQVFEAPHGESMSMKKRQDREVVGDGASLDRPDGGEGERMLSPTEQGVVFGELHDPFGSWSWEGEP